MNGQTYCYVRIIAISTLRRMTQTITDRQVLACCVRLAKSRSKGGTCPNRYSAGMQGYVQASVTISIGQIDLIRNSSP